MEYRKNKLKRPTNSTELRITSTEYARNEEYYSNIRDRLLDDYWYLINEQKVVSFDLVKDKVIADLLKLSSDDYLLIQKGQENKTYEI